MPAHDRSIARDALSRMVSVVDPAWTLQETRPAEDGHLAVYHVVVDAPGGTREYVLKASLGGERRGVSTEARLLAILNRYTSLPVPTVVGAVDEHEDVPTPYFLMESAPGTKLSKRDIGRLSDAVLARLARQTGRYLAELHALPGVEGYGQVAVDAPASARGGVPSADPAQLTVTDLQGASARSRGAWPTVVRAWAEDTLDRHETTQFGDLTPDVRAVVREHLDALSGPFRPTVARIDHGLHNLLLDPDTGDVTGMIDWAFTLSTPPAYDLVCVESNLCRGPWSMLHSTPDREELVRAALLDGYRDGGGDVGQYRNNRALYELLSLLRAMTHLDVSMRGATDAQRAAAAAGYRAAIRARL